MSTDAPTASRHSTILALQVVLARRWQIGVADIRAALLNGLPAPRGLHSRTTQAGDPFTKAGAGRWLKC